MSLVFGDMRFAQWSRRINSPFSPYHEITTQPFDFNKMNCKYEQEVRLQGTIDHGATNHFKLHKFFKIIFINYCLMHSK
jgi:hypothetical protein